MLANVVRKGASKLASRTASKRRYATTTEATVAKYTQNGRAGSVLKYEVRKEKTGDLYTHKHTSWIGALTDCGMVDLIV